MEGVRSRVMRCPRGPRPVLAYPSPRHGVINFKSHPRSSRSPLQRQMGSYYHPNNGHVKASTGQAVITASGGKWNIEYCCHGFTPTGGQQNSRQHPPGQHPLMAVSKRGTMQFLPPSQPLGLGRNCGAVMPGCWRVTQR